MIFKLNYIPHETLRALLLVLKQNWSGTLAGGVAGLEFGVGALKCFHRWAVVVCTYLVIVHNTAGILLFSQLISRHEDAAATAWFVLSLRRMSTEPVDQLKCQFFSKIHLLLSAG